MKADALRKFKSTQTPGSETHSHFLPGVLLVRVHAATPLQAQHGMRDAVQTHPLETPNIVRYALLTKLYPNIFICKIFLLPIFLLIYVFI